MHMCACVQMLFINECGSVYIFLFLIQFFLSRSDGFHTQVDIKIVLIQHDVVLSYIQLTFYYLLFTY